MVQVLRSSFNRTTSSKFGVAFLLMAVLLVFSSFTGETFEDTILKLEDTNTSTDLCEGSGLELLSDCGLTVTSIEVYAERDCGSADGSITVAFTDTNPGSTYKIKYKTFGDREFIVENITASPATIPNLIVNEYWDFQVIRENDNCASATSTDKYFVKPGCSTSDYAQGRMMNCGTGNIIHNNCNGMDVTIDRANLTQNTYILSHPSYSNSCIAFVNSDCTLSNRENVYCGDVTLSSPSSYTYGTLTFTPVSAASLGWSDLNAGRLNYIFENQGGYSIGEIQAAIWAITNGNTDNALSTAAKNNVTTANVQSGIANNIRVYNPSISTVQPMIVPRPTPVPTPDVDFLLSCDDGKTVDVYADGTNSCSGNPDASVNIPAAGNAYQTVVEVVYKNENPGSSVTVNADGVEYDISEVTIAGGSPNVRVYRGLLPGGLSNIYTNDVDGNCGSNNGLQSLVAYAFRDIDTGNAISGKFTEMSGFCDVETLTLPIPFDPENQTRDVTVVLPISELTTSGRYLTVYADADGAVGETTIYGPDAGLSSCCVDIVEVTIPNVAGNTMEINLEIRTDAANAPAGYSDPLGNGCGQSWVIAGLVYANIDCGIDVGLEVFNDCGSGRSIDVYAKGLKDTGSDCITIPAGNLVTRVIAEVWVEQSDCAGNVFPNTLTLSADGVTQSAPFSSVQQASSSGVAERLYRTVFNGTYNTICVSDLMSCNASSLALYVERMNDDGSSSLVLIDYELHDDATPTGQDDCVMTTLQLGESGAARDVDISIPIHEKDNVRQVEITITAKTAAGTVVMTENNTFTSQNAGDEAALYTMTFNNLPGNATQVMVEVCSPDPNGDSFGIGGVVSSTTGCVTCIQPQANNDNYSEDCGNSVSGNVLNNDQLFGSTNPSVTIISQPANGTVSINNNGAFTYTLNNSGTCTDDQFTYRVCFEGNTSPECCAEATAFISIGEDSDPVLNNTPTPTLSFDCVDDVPAPANVTASDNCGAGQVNVNFNEIQNNNPGNPNCDFILIRTWTATDRCGNFTAFTQTINVQDDIKPEFAKPATITIECDENIPAVVFPTATDNCSNSFDINVELVSETSTQGTDPNDCSYYTYEIIRMFRATDECGNFFQDGQLIEVNDTEAPVLTNCPASTTTTGTFPPVSPPTFVDNCDNDLTIVFNETTPAGIRTLTFSMV